MITWYKKRKLKSLVTKLAVYNDKGISWRHDNESSAETERTRLLLLIQKQVESLASEELPSVFLAALKNGNLKTDVTGKYIPYAK